MRPNTFLVCLLGLAGSGVGIPGCGGQDPALNHLSDTEIAEGWTLLFDGTLDGWRGYQRQDVPGGWRVESGILTFEPGVDDGDLLTARTFSDFELSFEWKLEEGGNSGVFFRVTETEPAPYWTGPEMQILDNERHPDGQSPLTSAGSNYALHAPVEDATRPVGEWNGARILVREGAVEHWLNGVRVVSYTLWSDEWRSLVAGSKFSEWPAYGLARRGHVSLQDHGDRVWYRNIKIREL